MKKQNAIYVFSLSLGLVACESVQQFGKHYVASGWKTNSNEIIAIVQDIDDYPYTEYAREVVAFNEVGQELTRVQLTKPVRVDAFFDRLFFCDQTKFFVQIDADIYLVNSQTGVEEILIANQKFISASKSGKLILTSNENSLSDTTIYSLFSIEEGVPRQISKLFLPDENGYLYNRDVNFIGDSLLIGCYSDTGFCALALFDTLFGLRSSLNDNGRPMFPSFSEAANKLSYFSQSGFWLYDLSSKSVQLVSVAPSNVNAMTISPDAAFIIYTVNEEGAYILRPSKLMLLNLKTKEERQLSSGLVSSGQLSPDGKSVVYFTNNDRDIQLHIVPVP